MTTCLAIRLISLINCYTGACHQDRLTQFDNMGESDNDSWSVVDEDESMGDRSQAGASQRMGERNTGENFLFILRTLMCACRSLHSVLRSFGDAVAVCSASSDSYKMRLYTLLWLVHMSTSASAFVARPPGIPPKVGEYCRLRMYLATSSQPLGLRLLLLHNIARRLTNSREVVLQVLYTVG